MEVTRNSEVAHLLQQIEAEYQAAQQALSGVAVAGRHAYITARQENIGKCFEMLSTLMSSEEAIKIVAQTLEHDPASFEQGGDGVTQLE
jgi:uncharacterized protein YoaH (UPF0181 family)